MVTAAIFGLLVLLMFLGIPIAVSMALTAILSFLALGSPNLLMMVPQRMYSGTTSFTLLAIPFFILAGNLMNTGGITIRLIHFAQCLVGHIRGGLGHVTVVTNMIMAGMSGAAVADAVGTGNILIPAMEKAGYPRVFSAALVGAAATIGPIIPPSIPFVIFGSMTGTSVGRLFLGGFLPGVLMGLLLMITVAIISKRRGYPRERRATLGELALGHGPCGAGLGLAAHHHRGDSGRASSRPPRRRPWPASTRCWSACSSIGRSAWRIFPGSCGRPFGIPSR